MRQTGLPQGQTPYVEKAVERAGASAQAGCDKTAHVRAASVCSAAPGLEAGALPLTKSVMDKSSTHTQASSVQISR
nr:hypothetical protein [Maliibacterium massiliense]